MIIFQFCISLIFTWTFMWRYKASIIQKALKPHKSALEKQTISSIWTRYDTVTDLIGWLHYLGVCLDREIYGNYYMDYLNYDLISSSDYV